MDFLIFAAVFAISLLAAFVDVIAGGSSLITIPALAILGVPIIAAIGTNRAYVVTFMLVGLLNYLHKKVPLNLKLVCALAAVKMGGAYIGTYYILSVPVASVKLLAAALIICALAAIFFLRRVNSKRKVASTQTYLLIALAVLAIGFYEGAVGGGGGTILRLMLTLLLGITMIEAALADVIITFSASFVSAAIFVSQGAVDYPLLLPMVLGGAIGAYAGSHMALKKGEAWVQNFVYLVCILLIAKLVLFP